MVAVEQARPLGSPPPRRSDDYQAAVDGNPSDRALLGNLAEAEAKLGNRAAVYALVDRFLELGGELDAARVAELKQDVDRLGP